MTDDLRDRIGKSYGHLAPADDLRERVLGDLSAERVTPNLWRRPMAIALTLLVIASIAWAVWSGEGGGDVPRTTVAMQHVASFHVDGDANEVVSVMARRLQALGLVPSEVRAGPGGEVSVYLPADEPPAPAYPVGKPGGGPAIDAATEAVLLRPGTFEFRIVLENPADGEGVEMEMADGTRPIIVSETAEFGSVDMDPEEIVVHPSPLARGFMVAFGIVAERREEFEEFTRANVRRRLAIIVDGRVESAPMIQSPLPGEGIISGGGANGFTRAEAESLAAILKSGAYSAEVRRGR